MNAELVEAVAIPQDVYDYELGAGLSVNGELREKVLIQEIKSVTLLIDGESINVPLNGATISYENAQTTAQGSKIWWPQTDPDATSSDENKVCLHGPCVRYNTIIPPGPQTSTCKFNDEETGVAGDTTCHKRVDFVVEMKSKSYTWWNSASISSLVDGKQWGINAEKSGTFADIPNPKNLESDRIPSYNPKNGMTGVEMITLLMGPVLHHMSFRPHQMFWQIYPQTKKRTSMLMLGLLLITWPIEAHQDIFHMVMVW